MKKYLLLLVWILFTFASCSKDSKAPTTEVESLLKRYFQERFIKLECVGGNQTFYYPTGGSHEVTPAKALLTFKAKVNIDNHERTIVGDIKVSAFLSSNGFGARSSTGIGFGIYLENWHFLKADEKSVVYCIGDSYLSKFFRMINKKAFKFHSHNTYFVASQRLPKELAIDRKLCERGEEKYCAYVREYDDKKSLLHHGKWSDKKENKAEYNEVVKGFAKRFYSRICAKNVQVGCEQLTHIKDNIWLNVRGN